MTNNATNNGKKRSRSGDSSGIPLATNKPSLSARFYSFLYRVLPDWLSYRLLSQGVPDTRYWGERGERRLAGSTSHGASSI